jgi:hypothetical protein
VTPGKSKADANSGNPREWPPPAIKSKDLFRDRAGAVSTASAPGIGAPIATKARGFDHEFAFWKRAFA